ncbi:MAG: glycine cleavage system protein H [Methylovirgula sp.]|uniref:glycine cleavage system protein H n=1 Tax=Methylovirgula sp. TaxID=1978224 RepID=UPI0030761050
MLRFTNHHEWLRLDGDIALIGITSYAARAAGTFISAELPKLGTIVKKGERTALLVSVTIAFEVMAPADGEVIEVNTDVIAMPSRVNADPQGNGWLFRLCINDAALLDGLMDEDAYTQFTAAGQRPVS